MTALGEAALGQLVIRVTDYRTLLRSSEVRPHGRRGRHLRDAEAVRHGNALADLVAVLESFTVTRLLNLRPALSHKDVMNWVGRIKMWKRHGGVDLAVYPEMHTVRGSLAALDADLSTAHELYGQSRADARAAWRALADARNAAGATSLSQTNDHIERAESGFSTAMQRRTRLAFNTAKYLTDAERVRNGGSLAPQEVRAFQQHLRSVGIDAVVAGDALLQVAHSDDQAAHAQAALGPAVWALVIPADGYRTACDHAAEAGYLWPLASQGPGTARGVLAFGDQQGLGRILKALDAVAATDSKHVEQLSAVGESATTINGMRHDPAMSRLAPIRDEVLHPRARAHAITRIDRASADATQELNMLEAELPLLRADLIAAYFTRDLLQRLEDTRQTFRLAGREHAHVCLGRRWLQQKHSDQRLGGVAHVGEQAGGGGHPRCPGHGGSGEQVPVRIRAG